ncbi:MAG TPA: hypothetical protein VHX90_05610 [Verrucomicrobiae bacterium]|nr:hypothetical protein [Verrucomicrobiae bacterium]
MESSPAGAKEFPVRWFSAVPSGLEIVLTQKPAVETAGYFRSSLRD